VRGATGSSCVGYLSRADPGLSAARDTIVRVKRALAWFAGLVGIAALGRWLAGRNRPKPPSAPVEPEAVEAGADDPAEELRRKLAQARAEGEVEPPAETPTDEALDDRRARVHAQARETIDAMAEDGPE